jgi:hypothetical protein
MSSLENQASNQKCQVFFFGGMGFELRLCAGQAGALLLESHFTLFALPVFQIVICVFAQG